MKHINLKQGRYALVDDEDYEELNAIKWCCLIKIGKTTYARNSRLGYMHRMIMSAKVGQQVDHINGDGIDNRKSNLRLCTQSQNTMNSKPNANTTSKFKGVCWYKRCSKWVSQIKTEGVNVSLGYFDSEEEAAFVYNLAAVMLFGEFARTNFLGGNQ